MMSEDTTAVQGKRILYVDDEQALTLLGEELLGDSGAQVVCAFSGTHALELFHQHSGQFDLVVTDESMPGMSGIELAQELFRVAPDLPVVLCSGHLLSMNDKGITETNIKDVLAKTDVFFKLPQIIEEIFPTRT